MPLKMSYNIFMQKIIMINLALPGISGGGRLVNYIPSVQIGAARRRQTHSNSIDQKE